MRLKNNILGKNISLRSAISSDAEFILYLRLNPDLNKFIKSINPSVKNQRDWISNKLNEKNDYHMIIEQKNTKKQLGIIALYDINFNDKTFDWGRWIIDKNAPNSTSIESALLLYELAFEEFRLKKSLFEVQKKNKKVVNFHKLFGATILKEDEIFYYFELMHSTYLISKQKYKKYTRLKND
jgi:RimJ/RimL family protein N-acetyltransferase